MSAHTKEPWTSDLVAEMIYGANGQTIVYEMNSNEADARRIVACVNACAGISNEQLERVRFADDHPSYDELKHDLDELRKAMNGIANLGNGDSMIYAKQIAVDALRKYEAAK